MGTKIEKEGDFKKILKRLLVEKKQRDGESQELLQSKIEKLQNVALEEEIAALKEHLIQSETEKEQLLQQCEKIKTTLQKSQHECGLLEGKVAHLEEEAKLEEKRRQERSLEISALQEQGQIQLEKWSHERALWEKKQGKLQQQLAEIGEEREIIQENFEKLEKAYKQNQRHFRDENETHINEIMRLQEKLLAIEHQLKQTDLAKVHEEYEKCMGQVKTENEGLRNELTHVKQSALLALENKEKLLQEKIQEGHQAIQAWREKCQQLEDERLHFKRNWEEKAEEGATKDEIVVALQRENKELQLKVEEGESEVQKAQLHLAKKVKESALLQDVAYKQKEQIIETQKQWSKESERRIALEKNLDDYQQKEDQLKQYAAQCTQETQELMNEFTHRYSLLQQEKEKERVRADELEKYREAYEKLLVTLQELK